MPTSPREHYSQQQAQQPAGGPSNPASRAAAAGDGVAPLSISVPPPSSIGTFPTADGSGYVSPSAPRSPNHGGPPSYNSRYRRDPYSPTGVVFQDEAFPGTSGAAPRSGTATPTPIV